jgi:hypothetical protein
LLFRFSCSSDCKRKNIQLNQSLNTESDGNKNLIDKLHI